MTLIIVAALPITVIISQQQQETRQRADSGCINPINYPLPPNGGMTYANWYFDQAKISSITIPFTINNDPGPTSDEYLQFYDTSVDGTGSYFGVQTIGLALFSRWGTNDLSNVRLGPNATKVAGTENGAFVSLRLNYQIPVGNYIATVKRAEFDGTGDWFDYYLTKNGVQTYVGGIRFTRATTGTPAGFSDGGGSWTEFWDNNNNTQLYPVPVWSVSVGIPTANDTFRAKRVITSYSPMPNSDIYLDGAQIHMKIGDSTPRCHSATTYDLSNLVITPTPTIIPTSTPTPTPIQCAIRSGLTPVPCPTGYYCFNTCNPPPGSTGCAQYDICKPNPSPTPNITLVPTTITPAPTPNITLSFNLGIDGVGAAGDHQKPCSTFATCGSNKEPKNTSIPIAITLLAYHSPSDTSESHVRTMLNYDKTSGTFKGTLALDPLGSGPYTTKVRSPGSLIKTLANNQNITKGINDVPTANLTVGDIDMDNQLSILDYNILISCSSFSIDKKALCNKNTKPHDDFQEPPIPFDKLSDLNNDGVVDILDYQLFLREYLVQNGD